MGSILHIAGVDPGLVHTGVVILTLSGTDLEMEHHIVDGIDAPAVADAVGLVDICFIEKYRPRMHYGTDDEMVKGEAALKRELPKAVLVNNMGANKVVTPALLKRLGLWDFPTTHHQDLRSAARIAVLGMMKDPRLNRALADRVKTMLDGEDHDA